MGDEAGWGGDGIYIFKSSWPSRVSGHFWAEMNLLDPTEKERKCLKWGNKSFVFPATAGLRKEGSWKSRSQLFSFSCPLLPPLARRSCPPSQGLWVCVWNRISCQSSSWISQPTTFRSQWASDKKKHASGYKVRHLPLQGLCVSLSKRNIKIIFALTFGLYLFCVNQFCCCKCWNYNTIL